MMKKVKAKILDSLKYIGIACLSLASLSPASAQSSFKESNNHFARYTHDGKLNHLVEAKKHIDKTYENKRDARSSRVNILRAMIYSSMAYADSTRTVKYEEDPIDVTLASVKKIRDRDKSDMQGELSFVFQNLASAHVYAAEKAMEKEEFESAYMHFKEVNKINSDDVNILNNLALLAYQAKKYEEAERYFNSILRKGDYDVDHYLQLAKVYSHLGDSESELKTLEKAEREFPGNKEVVLKLVNIYRNDENYKALSGIITKALSMEPESTSLNYMAGFAFENLNNLPEAIRYYKRVVQLEENNYEGNLALGLIKLKTYLNDSSDENAQEEAQNYLLRANEIKPYATNALQSLAVLYENTGDESQLDRVNLLLNQIESK